MLRAESSLFRLSHPRLTASENEAVDVQKARASSPSGCSCSEGADRRSPGILVLPSRNAGKCFRVKIHELSTWSDTFVPGCHLSLTGTTTIATTSPQSPFTANADGSIPPTYAATGQGYDVVFSGGVPPNTYPHPVTLTDVQVGGGGGCQAAPSLARRTRLSRSMRRERAATLRQPRRTVRATCLRRRCSPA